MFQRPVPRYWKESGRQGSLGRLSSGMGVCSQLVSEPLPADVASPAGFLWRRVHGHARPVRPHRVCLPSTWLSGPDGRGQEQAGVSLHFKHHHGTLGTCWLVSFREGPVPAVPFSADAAHSMVTFQVPAVVGPVSAGGENALNAICYLPLAS